MMGTPQEVFMRRSMLATLSGAFLALALAAPASAKFGMSKTKVTLKRPRPPQVLLLGETATVEVTSASRRVPQRSLDRIGQRIKDAIRAGGPVSITEGKTADNVVKVAVEDLDADINDTVNYEDKYVQTGTKEEWNEKKKKMETKAVYGYRREPVRLRTARGHVDVHLEVKTPGGERNGDASVSYQQEFKGDTRVPTEASSESALEQYLVDEAAEKAAAVVAYTPDPVDAMLAVDGELKDGNRLAEAGLWKEALSSWSARTFKGDKEAARQHNIGVAHEALAFTSAPDSGEHKAELEQASEAYKKALALDPGEKYFAEPIQRVQTSLQYAETARRYAADFQHWKEDAPRRRSEPTARAAEPTAAPPAPRRATTPGAPTGTPAKPAPPRPATPAPAETGLGSSAALALPLRNGSFESSVAPWTVSGKGSVVEQSGRGKVLQATASGAPVSVAQAVSVDVAGVAATINLDYKVAAGEGQVRVLVTYEDAQGRSRTFTLPVTAGDPPGGWTPWTGDLAAIRPAPARVKEIKVSVDGGTVLLDNVALNVR
jgi:hypothetical protein